MVNELYGLILHEIQAMSLDTKVRKHGSVEENYESNGCNTNLAEIVVNFATKRKKNWRGLLLREREPVVDIWDIRRRIRYKLNYFPTKVNDMRLEYQEKKEYDGQKLLNKVVITTSPLFISESQDYKSSFLL